MSQSLIGYDTLSIPTIKRVYPTFADPGVFATKEEISRVKLRLKVENRDNKITSIIDGVEFIEKKLEDDLEYQKLSKKGIYQLKPPSNILFFVDYLTILK